MKDDDINVEMIWAGKDTACAWVVLLVFHGVVTASISDIFFHRPAPQYIWVPGDGSGVQPLSIWEDHLLEIGVRLQ